MKWTASAPNRLIAFLQDKLEGRSGKSLRKLLEANLCRINGKVERFASRKIVRGDFVELGALQRQQEESRFETIYEDESLWILNKPAGWVSQNIKKARLVHRLDKDTTGLLLFAKTDLAEKELLSLFANRQIEKQYIALVDGVVKEIRGERISRFCKKGSYQGQTIWGSGHSGPIAITHWEKLVSEQDSTLLLCSPKTGRTHQIRVHMAEMGHPILVDRQYASKFQCPCFFERPLLHAYRLRFSFQGRCIDVKAPLSRDFPSKYHSCVSQL